MPHPVTTRQTPTQQWLSLEDAAKVLGVQARTVRAWIGDGTLTGYRVGPRFIRVDAAEVESLPKRIAATQ